MKAVSVPALLYDTDALVARLVTALIFWVDSSIVLIEVGNS